MNDEQHNEMMLVVFNTIASQAMNQLLGLFDEGAQIGLIVAFPGEDEKALYTGSMTSEEAETALNILNKNGPDVVERTYTSRSDGDVISLDPINPTDIT